MYYSLHRLYSQRLNTLSLAKQSFSSFVDPSSSFLCKTQPPPNVISVALKSLSLMQRHMKISANSVKTGHVIERKGKPYLVLKTQHVVSGRGSANVKVELKSITDGSKVSERYSSSESVEELKLVAKKVKYLYHTDDTIAFVDDQFDELVLPGEYMQGWPDIVPLLSDTTPVSVSFLNDQPVCAKLDARTLVLPITETEATPAMVTNASMKGVGYKPAFIHGLRVEVPDFCHVGDEIEVTLLDDQKLAYVKRVSKK